MYKNGDNDKVVLFAGATKTIGHDNDLADKEKMDQIKKWYSGGEYGPNNIFNKNDQNDTLRECQRRFGLEEGQKIYQKLFREALVSADEIDSSDVDHHLNTGSSEVAKNLAFEIRRQKALDATIAEMDKEHVYIGLIGKKGPYVTVKAPDEVTGKRTTVIVSPDTFKGQYPGRNNIVNDAATGKPINKADYWLANTKNIVKTITYDPSKEPGVIADDNGNKLLNLWEGLGVEPKKGKWRLTKRHIFEVLCNSDRRKYRYVIKWLAWAVQNPHKRAEVVIVFKGDPGSGKSFLFKQFKKIFGTHGMVISSPETLTSNFNSFMRKLSFLFCDEAYAPEDKKAQGRIKAIITEEFIETEGKFEDTLQMVNRLHIAMCTNNDRAIPAIKGERRYFIEQVSNKYAQRKQYFDPLWREMEAEGGLEAMLYTLSRMDLKGWHPRDDKNVLQTAELANQIDLNNKPHIQMVRDFLERGTLPEFRGTHLIGGNEIKEADGSVWVHSESLIKYIIGDSGNSTTMQRLKTEIGSALGKLGSSKKGQGSTRQIHRRMSLLHKMRNQYIEEYGYYDFGGGEEDNWVREKTEF